MQRSFLIVGFGVVAVIAAAAAVFQLMSPQAEAQRGSAVRFEYAVINGGYVPYPPDNNASSVSAAVNICYLQPTGCQNEEVKFDLNIAKFAQDERLDNSPLNVRSLAQDRAVQSGYSKAISKLGAEGWEVVAGPPTEFTVSYFNQQGARVFDEGANRPPIWFKRTRQ